MKYITIIENGAVSVVLKPSKKFKCPYCEKRLERTKLPSHIQTEHEDMIPEGYTALRVSFNTINHKTEGHCIICKMPTDWNENKGRYERLCNNPKCKEQYRRMIAERNKNKYGTERLQTDPRYAEAIQQKALAGRHISGTYKFEDGGTIKYVGSYEKQFLEFMDLVLHCKSEDIDAPGPAIIYTLDNKQHMYLPDFYYIPYNLLIEIKDGGSNPNNHPKRIEEEKKNKAKEAAVYKLQKYNYVRVTNNDFSQLLQIMAALKYQINDSKNELKPIIISNESTSVQYQTLTKKRGINKTNHHIKDDDCFDDIEGYDDKIDDQEKDSDIIQVPDAVSEDMVSTIGSALPLTPEYNLSNESTSVQYQTLTKKRGINKTNHHIKDDDCFDDIEGYDDKIDDQEKDSDIIQVPDAVSEDMVSTIGSALPLTPEYNLSNRSSNYYLVQDMKNNVFEYGISNGPFQQTTYNVETDNDGIHHIKTKNSTKHEKIFKIKDKEKAKELYDELEEMVEYGQKYFIDNRYGNDYIYSRLTEGSKIIEENQLMFDDRFEQVDSHTKEMINMCNEVYNYLVGPKLIDILESQVSELEQKYLTGLFSVTDISHIKKQSIISELCCRLRNSSGQEYDDLYTKILNEGYNPELPYSNSAYKKYRENKESYILLNETTARDIIRNAEDSSPREISAMKKSVDPVFIVFTSANNIISNSIKWFTDSQWAHVSIGLDSSLDKTYSYVTDYTNHELGFGIEGLDKYKKQDPTMNIRVFAFFVTKQQKEKMRKEIQKFIKHKSETKYAFENIIKVVTRQDMNNRLTYKQSMICSQFVYNILMIGKFKMWKKINGVIVPEHLQGLSNDNRVYEIYTGNVCRYNQSKIDTLLNTLQKKIAKYIV